MTVSAFTRATRKYWEVLSRGSAWAFGPRKPDTAPPADAAHDEPPAAGIDAATLRAWAVARATPRPNEGTQQLVEQIGEDLRAGLADGSSPGYLPVDAVVAWLAAISMMRGWLEPAAWDALMTRWRGNRGPAPTTWDAAIEPLTALATAISAGDLERAATLALGAVVAVDDLLTQSGGRPQPAAARVELDLAPLHVDAAGLAAYGSALLECWKTGTLPDAGFHQMLALHCRSNAWFNDFAHAITARVKPPIRLQGAGIFPLNDPAFTRRVVDALDRDGFFRFDERLDPALCDALAERATKLPMYIVRPDPPTPAPWSYDQVVSLGSDGCHVDWSAAASDPLVQTVLFDPSIVGVAQDYLRCRPLVVGPAMWWSFPPPSGAPISSERAAEMAQQFHYDMDQLKFIKFFFYLSDVEESHGPHVMVRGSHRRGAKPQDLLDRGYARIPDEDIVAAHGRENVIVFTGAKGTCFAVDTRAWHKAAPPVSGPRLVLQVQFSTTFVGGSTPQRVGLDAIADPRQQAWFAANADLYAQFDLKGAATPAQR